jgi:hypothetical protein
MEADCYISAKEIGEYRTGVCPHRLPHLKALYILRAKLSLFLRKDVVPKLRRNYDYPKHAQEHMTTA